MSFSFPRDYLALARTLIDVGNQQVDPEALVRTTISRAYYAVFHSAQDRLFALMRDLDPYFNPRHIQDQSHERIWKCYAGAKLLTVAELGRRLKDRRRKADYDSRPPVVDEEALLAIEIAEKLAHQLKNLSPGDLKQLVEYLARN